MKYILPPDGCLALPPKLAAACADSARLCSPVLPQPGGSRGGGNMGRCGVMRDDAG